MLRLPILSAWLHRLVALTMLTMGAAGAAVFTFTPPAAAETCVWYTEQDIVDSVFCRETYLVEAGRGNLLSRDQLLAARGYYHGEGFGDQFLWYAPQQTVHVPDTRTQWWTGCDTGLPRVAGNACGAPADHHLMNSGRALKAEQIDLSSFAYGGRTIARACGNYLSPAAGPDPVPTALVEKYDDRNRNGQRDPGEPGLAGWQFQVDRIGSTHQDQGTGNVGSVTTGPDGTATFRFDGKGPGTYTVREVAQEGWAPTTGPTQTFVVPDGAGDAQVAHVRFGNAQTRADLAKVEFALIDPPARLDAHVGVDLVVHAEIRNNGPADVAVADSLDVAVVEDCRAEPAHHEATRELTAGQSAVLTFRFRLTCDRPSFHPVTFTDRLSVTTPGVEDPVLENNTRAFEHVFAVFDRADVRLTGTEVHCPERADITEVFECTVGATVHNGGPFGPVTVDVAFGVRLPDDCRVTGSTGATDVLSLDSGESRAVTSRWLLACAHRSFHDVTGDATATLHHLHVEDPVAGNATGTATARLGIFEPADLAAEVIDLRCTEREHNTTASACTATFRVRNNGPATGVAVRTDLVVTTEGCAAAPVTHRLTLDAGATATVTATWQLTCTGAIRHSVRVTGTVAADEPHAEDRAAGNNTTATVWGPGDVKPRSLPSSVNVGKEGVVPFALLSTPTLNTLTAVDRAGLRFGRTGTEASGITCAPGGEDVNDDGRLDLVCRASTQLTGIDCATTVLLVTDRLDDGTRFQSEDAVKVVGCK